MAETKTLISAEEFYELSSRDDRKLELIKGEIIEMSPPGWGHGVLAVGLGSILWPVVRKIGGYVAVESGVWLERDPDTVRGPDISIVLPDKVPPQEKREKFLEVAPDIAIEIVSPTDTVSEIQGKVEDYLRHGTRLVWVLEPRGRTITVYRPDGTARILTIDDSLTGEEVLPGFGVSIRDIFAVLD